LEIEQNTGVSMDERGREIVRQEIRKAAREYEAIRGSGIRLSSPETAETIAMHSAKRIVEAVKSSAKVHDRLITTHGEQMNDESKRKLLASRGLLGAIETSARQPVKMLTGKKV
jgi:hypothetical protein